MNGSVAIITCFSYSGDHEYVFHPNYLRADLRRLLDYCMNYVLCPYQNIYVITDLIPDPTIQKEIRISFSQQVNHFLARWTDRHLISSGKSNKKKKSKKSKKKKNIDEKFQQDILLESELLESELPLIWLMKRCRQTTSVHFNELYRKILKRIVPVLRSTNSVEFASLFTHIIKADGRIHYDRILRHIFRTISENTECLFYYTGHGVKHYAYSQQKSREIIQEEICLVIPNLDGSVEFYSRSELIKTFSKLMVRGPSLIVFDCCYADSLMGLPFQKGFDPSGQLYCKNMGSQIQSHDTICLTSTSNDQTCGFYSESGECGSVFTYYLMQCLQKIAHQNRSTNFAQFYSEVERNVNRYRMENGKLSQNMLIQVNREDLWELPSWLFRRKLD